jgi:hypothetical protein
MATETAPTKDEINHVILTGANTPLGNGLVRHTGRHPQSPDHRITVVTSRPAGGGRPVIKSAKREYMPSSEVISQAQQRQAAVKARTDRSTANKKAQLKKKQERSALANNKQKK